MFQFKLSWHINCIFIRKKKKMLPLITYYTVTDDCWLFFPFSFSKLILLTDCFITPSHHWFLTFLLSDRYIVTFVYTAAKYMFFRRFSLCFFGGGTEVAIFHICMCVSEMKAELIAMWSEYSESFRRQATACDSEEQPPFILLSLWRMHTHTNIETSMHIEHDNMNTNANVHRCRESHSEAEQ